MDGEYERQMKEIIEKEKLNSFFEFKGQLIDSGKWDALGYCYLHIHLTDYDGQPMTIIETMGMGIPCIATRIGAIPEMIENGKNGYLVTDILKEVPEIIFELINNERKYNSLSQNAKRIYNERFTEEIYLQNMNKFLTYTD